MNFGKALESLKVGKKVARQGWNGKGMFIYRVKGSTIQADDLRNEAHAHIGSKLEKNALVNISAHIDMKSADGSITIGWAPSQVDMLSEDWQVVEYLI